MTCQHGVQDQLTEVVLNINARPTLLPSISFFSQKVQQTHLMTSVDERRRFCSCSGTVCQVNTNRQSNPPIWGSPEFPKYWKVFQSITSMTGHTTADGSSLILEESREKDCWLGEAELWGKKIVHLKCQHLVLPLLYREPSYWANCVRYITALLELAGRCSVLTLWLFSLAV